MELPSDDYQTRLDRLLATLEGGVKKREEVVDEEEEEDGESGEELENT